MAALVISGLDDVALADRALRVGAYGYVVKPFSPNEVLVGVMGALSHRRRELDARDELREASAETIRRLSAAVEARDTNTAAHIIGMSDFCFAIARELGLPPERCELLRAASPMHDVGKVGVPDHVLLKPGMLTADRARADGAARGDRLPDSHRLAVRAAASRGHDRLDAPRALGRQRLPARPPGQRDPQEGQIAAVADVFDALTRDRVYRPRFSRGDALQIVTDARERAFDPDTVDALVAAVERDGALYRSSGLP